MWRAMVIPVVLLICVGGAGCKSTPKPKEEIPRRGDVVAYGRGEQLSFRAPAPGLVSIYDLDAKAIIQSSAVKESSVIVVNPQSGNITLADGVGTQIVHTNIKKTRPYEIWYIAAAPAPKAEAQK